MKDFLSYLVTSIVSNSDAVKISEQIEETENVQTDNGSNQVLHLDLQVAEEDMGLIIGKKGQTISAIRRLLRLRNLHTNEFQAVNLQLIENEDNQVENISEDRVEE